MVETINMQEMRYLNLFQTTTHIATRHTFIYNNTLFFCVPKIMISKAIGEGAKNIRRIGEILQKKVKVIASPRGEEDARVFIQAIINPNAFKDLEIRGNELILTAGGTQNKAALIGRNKRRLLGMQKIVQDYFRKDLRIA